MHFRMDRRCRDGDRIDGGGGKPEATGGGSRGARALPLANAPANPAKTIMPLLARQPNLQQDLATAEVSATAAPPQYHLLRTEINRLAPHDYAIYDRGRLVV